MSETRRRRAEEAETACAKLHRTLEVGYTPHFLRPEKRLSTKRLFRKDITLDVASLNLNTALGETVAVTGGGGGVDTV